MDRSMEVHLDRSTETKVAAAATKMTTEENKYVGFVRSPDLFFCKVKAAATMTRQRTTEENPTIFCIHILDRT
jgi:uridine phosphorylase